MESDDVACHATKPLDEEFEVVAALREEDRRAASRERSDDVVEDERVNGGLKS